jgi:hypothetical protein
VSQDKSQKLASSLKPQVSSGWLADPGCSLFERKQLLRLSPPAVASAFGRVRRAAREERVLLTTFSKPLTGDDLRAQTPFGRDRLRRFLTHMAPGCWMKPGRGSHPEVLGNFRFAIFDFRFEEAVGVNTGIQSSTRD